MSEWRTIDSAPKDGTRVLLAEGKLFTAGYWAKPDSPRDFPARWWMDNPVAFRTEDEETVNYDHYFDNYVREPTHWMPLPSPPES